MSITIPEEFLPKRIKNELRRDWNFPEGIYKRFVLDGIHYKDYVFDGVKYDTYSDESNDVVLYFRVKFNNKYAKVKIICDNKYPWKSPKVRINNYNYINLLRINYKLLEKLKIPTRCLCCSTILCNWRPYNNFVNILNEVVEYLDIKKRIVEVIFCEKIIDKYFGFYLPVIEFI